MADRRKKFMDLDWLTCSARLRHLLQRLFHFDAYTHITNTKSRHVFITIAGMDEANLQIGIVLLVNTSAKLTCWPVK